MNQINCLLFFVFLICGSYTEPQEPPDVIYINDWIYYDTDRDTYRAKEGFVRLPRVARDSMIKELL